MTQAVQEQERATIGHNSVAAGEMIAEDPKVIFREPDLVEQYLAEIEAQIADFEYDLETQSGRDAIAGLAHGVIKYKSKMDNAGKELTEEHRDAVNKVNAVRKQMRDGLDKLKAKAREPLDEWNEKQAQIAAERTRVTDTIDESILLPIGHNAELIDHRLSVLRDLPIDAEMFGEDWEKVLARRDAAILSLTDARARLVAAEKAAADLAAAEAKAKAEEERRIAAEEEAARKAAEDKRIAEAAEAAARKEREQAEAEAKAAEDQAKAELERVRAEAAEKEQAALRAQAEAEAEAAKIKADADAKAKADADAKAKALAEKQQREADQQHRKTVIAEVTASITKQTTIATFDAAALLGLIADGKVPHVTIQF